MVHPVRTTVALLRCLGLKLLLLVPCVEGLETFPL